MKHVFVISNHLSQEICKKIIEVEKLKAKDIIIITRNRFQAKLDYHLIADPTLKLDDNLFTLSIKQILSLYEFTKSWLDENISSEFCLYSPNAAVKIFRLLANNQKCVAYSFFEEGLGAFQDHYWKKHINLPNLVYKYIPIYSRFMPNNLMNRKYKNLYRISRRAYLLRHRVVDLGDLWFEPLSLPKLTENSHLFILQTMKWFTHDFSEAYWKACKLLLNKISPSDKIYVKPHPEQYVQSEKSKILDVFPSTKVKYLGDESFLEHELSSVSICNIYTLSSSVLLYIKGSHKVINIFNSMNCDEPSKANFLETIPSNIALEFGLDK